MVDQINQVFEAILDGDSSRVCENVKEALNSGITPETILNQGMIPAMDEVGKRFEEGDFFVPEMLVSARAMKEGLNLLKPLLAGENHVSLGQVIIGTVSGDLHDIGKNLVAIMLEGAGFEIIDLGTDVQPEKFIEEINNRSGHESPLIVGLSALLTTTMYNMELTIHALEEAGIRDRVKIMIGGAPVTENYARQIKADGYAPDASRAVSIARSFVETR
jgi:5-methyltetrahydrofolate--homocysteine methyltransferase